MRVRTWAVLVLALVWTPQAMAEAFAWKISKGKSEHWLVGSVHALPERAHPLGEAYQRAYAAADGLIFETDMAGINDPGLQASVMQMGMAPQGIKADIGASMYGQLQARLSTMGLPTSTCDAMRAWLCAVSLEMAALMQAGMTPDLGVDQHFFQRARLDRKRVEWLEAPLWQLSLLAGERPDDPVLLREMLRVMDDSEQQPTQLVDAWIAGDVGAMGAMVNDMRDQHRPMYERLLAERNRSWSRQLETYFDDVDHHWLLVAGAAHMPGPDGLLQLLRQQGFTVTAID